MLSRFSSWFLGNRFRRVLLIAGFMVLPLTGLISAGLCALNGQVHGWKSALTDAGMATVLLLILVLLSSGGAALTGGGAGMDIVLVGAVTWLICSLTGSLAGSYQSLNLPVQLLVMGGCVLVGLVFLVVGDPTQAWQLLMTQLYEDLGGRGFQMPGEDELRAAAQIMTGLMAASAVASMILALIVGGWLAGEVTGSPLSARFTGLRMGYVIGGLAALAGIASILSLGSLADNLLLVLVMGFVFQGLAVVHWQARARGWPSFWPLALYLPMAMPPLSMLVLVAVSAVGFTDNWYNLRRPRVDMIK